MFLNADLLFWIYVELFHLTPSLRCAHREWMIALGYGLHVHVPLNVRLGSVHV